MFRIFIYFTMLISVPTVFASDCLTVENESDLDLLPKAVRVSFNFKEDNYFKPKDVVKFFETYEPDLSNVKVLDLSNLNLNDKNVKDICDNPSLRRLMRLNLSENQKVTIESIRFILKSKTLGSIRDLPQLCGTLGIPSVLIEIDCTGTQITRDILIGKDLGTNYPFGIIYRHFQFGYETSSPAKNGIKYLEVKCSNGKQIVTVGFPRGVG